MSPQPHTTSARLLAPIALVACALALVVVAGSSLGGGDADGGGDAKQRPAAAPKRSSKPAKSDDSDRQARSQARSGTYTVKAGDTPGSIASDVGITVERLLELNPDLDPNSLVAGQKIKLRE